MRDFDRIIQLVIDAAAQEREALHRDDPGGRQLTDDTHRTGLLGEFKFGGRIGQMPDLSCKRNGDGGIDFVVPVLMTLDVKTRHDRPNDPRFYMLVEERKVAADLYVCAIIADDGTTDCVGWMLGRDVETYPVGDLGTGVRNHQVPVDDLQAISELEARIPNWRNGLARLRGLKLFAKQAVLDGDDA
ncbi:MAG: hypothetical protein J2P55_00225 [Rhizobiales bacterium]|nr:hypothetical protein [Hyphomicrobiales bacterium]